MDSPLFLYLPDSRTVTIVVWVWEVEDCIGRCEALGADPLDLNIPDILQPDGATQLVIEQPKLGVLVTDQNSKELKHFHHLTSWTSGAKASPSVPMMSWQIPFIPLASELGVGPMSSHQPSGSLPRFSQVKLTKTVHTLCFHWTLGHFGTHPSCIFHCWSSTRSLWHWFLWRNQMSHLSSLSWAEWQEILHTNVLGLRVIIFACLYLK